MEAPELRLVGVLAIPHALYAFIWFRPRAFAALCCGADAVTIFARLAAALKGARAARSRLPVAAAARR